MEFSWSGAGRRGPASVAVGAGRGAPATKNDRRRHFVREEVEACKRLTGIDVFLSHEAARPFPLPRVRDAGKTPINEVLASMRPRLHLFGHHHRYWVGERQQVTSIGLETVSESYLLIDGKTLEELGLTEEVVPRHYSVKESVFPFSKFAGVDIILGPEMRSTGEVMGIDASFGIAFAKAQLGGGMRLPKGGRVFISVRDEDKPSAAAVAQKLHGVGFAIVATRGTAAFFAARGIPAETVNKVQDGSPHIGDQIKKGAVAMVINTPEDAHSHADSYLIRRYALDYQVPYFTTMAGAEAAAEGIEYLKQRDFEVHALQDYEAPALP